MTECTEYSSNQQICLLAYELRGEPFPDCRFPVSSFPRTSTRSRTPVPGFKLNAFPFGKTRESTFSCRMKACWPCMLVSVLVCDSVRRAEDHSAVTVGMSLANHAVSSRTQRAWEPARCVVKSSLYINNRQPYGSLS